MNRNLLIILSCALILSASGSYLVYKAVTAHARPSTPQRTAELVVAARDLEAGTLIHDADLRTAAWFGPIPKGGSVKRDGFLNRGVSSPMFEGEPVTENHLSSKGSGGGLAAMIPPGMRACAVRVNEVVGLAGFVVPGMRVDVLITGLPPGGNALDGPKVRTLLQNIQVLSAGTNFLKDQEGKPEQAQVVNLLVTPPQAEVLSLASNETRIQLVLRNPMDTLISTPPGTAMSDLFGGARGPDLRPPDRPGNPASAKRIEQAPAAAPATRLYTIHVSNGSVHSEATFNRYPGKP